MTEDPLSCIREPLQEERLIVEYTPFLDRITLLTVRGQHYKAVPMEGWLDLLKTEDEETVGIQVWGFSRLVADQSAPLDDSKHVQNRADLLAFLVDLSSGKFR